MSIIIVLIVAILVAAGLITFNIRSLSPDKPDIEEDSSLDDAAPAIDKEPQTEVLDPQKDDHLKMKDDDYRSVLAKMHNQSASDDRAPNTRPPGADANKMRDNEYRGTLKDLKKDED